MKRRISAAIAALAWLQTLCGILPERTHHIAGEELTDSVVRFALPQRAEELTVEVRAMPVKEKERPGMSRQAWSVSWPDGLRIELRNGNSAFGDAADTRFTRVSVSKADSTMLVKDFSRGFSSLPGHANSLIVKRDTGTGAVTISGGGRVPVKIGNISMPPSEAFDSVAIEAEGKVRVLLASSEFSPDLREGLETDWSKAALAGHFACSSDPMEGFWSYFDRENDPTCSRPGGRYVLATVSDGEGGYTILYVDGAETCRDSWREGMVKGRLKPTVFVDQYDLEWIDAELGRISSDIHARTDAEGSLLILEFPLMKMRMRFARQPLVRDF